MAGLRKIGILSNKLLINKIPDIHITRNCSDLKKYVDKVIDLEKPSAYIKYMPGHYPKTQEERIKAAEKYGVHPYEYKPFPPDENYAGDYPDLPWISVEAKDPYYPWDFPALRRNLDDPVHLNFEMLGDDRYNYGVREFIGRTEGCLIFLATIATVFILHYIVPYSSVSRMEKQFPKDGVHYTFEPAV